MIDIQLTIEFCNRHQITVEEYVFLLSVFSVTENKENKELILELASYYEKNRFYGRDIYPAEIAKAMNWELLIEKLVLQGYLLDYRTDKKVFNLNKLVVTELFSSKIWSTDKEKYYMMVLEIIQKHTGSLSIEMGNGSQQEIYTMTSDDLKIYGELDDYFWKVICHNGNLHYTEKFLYDLEVYVSHYKRMNKKLLTFFNSYKSGALKMDIERIKGNSNRSIYTKL